MRLTAALAVTLPLAKDATRLDRACSTGLEIATGLFTDHGLEGGGESPRIDRLDTSKNLPIPAVS